MPRLGVRRSRTRSGGPGTGECRMRNGKADLLVSHLRTHRKTGMVISPVQQTLSRFLYLAEKKKQYQWGIAAV